MRFFLVGDEVVTMSSVVYRASELGGCTKALIAKRLGYTPMDPPEKFKGYFKRGDDAESIMVAMLDSQGYRIDSRQLEVRLQCSETVAVVGHIDGIISDDQFGEVGDGRLWECKRVSPSVYKEFVERGWEADYPLLSRYKWQTSCYMLGVDRELRMDVIAEVDGQLKFHTLYRELPFYSELQIRTRVLGIEAVVASGDLPDDCDKPSYPCPFYYLPGHDPDKAEANEVLVALIKEALAAKHEAEVATARERELRRDLLAAFPKGETSVRSEVATLSLQKSTRTEWDQEALNRDGVDLDKYRKKVSGNEYVRITPKKVKEVVTDDG